MSVIWLLSSFKVSSCVRFSKTEILRIEPLELPLKSNDCRFVKADNGDRSVNLLLFKIKVVKFSGDGSVARGERLSIELYPKLSTFNLLMEERKPKWELLSH